MYARPDDRNSWKNVVKETNLEFFRKSVLDKASPIPIFYQIKEVLRDYANELRDRSGAAGFEAIPSESELMEVFGVSRATVRQSIRELIADGYLFAVQGKGTFIRTDKIEQLGYLRSFHATMTRLGHKVDTNVLEQSISTSTEFVEEALNLPKDSEVIKIRRLRLIDAVPNHIALNYFPAEKYHGLLEIDLTNRSLMEVLETEFNVKLVSQSSTIQANISGDYDSRLLNVPIGFPILQVETVNYTEKRVPIDYYIARYKGDFRIKYSTEF